MNRFQVVPAAYVLLHQDSRVLLQLRRGTGYMDGHWAAAAAGHVERGESVLQAACREAMEELGVHIAEDDLVPLCAMHRTHDDQPVNQRVDFFFTCHRWTGTPRRIEHGKTEDLQWFDVTALPHPVVPHERFVLDALAAGPVPAVVTYGF